SLMVVSRLVPSIWKRSTWGVFMTPGGKWSLMPMGATKPGPRNVELGSVMLGFDSTSRWVMVLWLMNWMVREVSGAWSFPKQAPVRAWARAPSTAKTSALVFWVISGETPPSTRRPSNRPPRSTTAMMAPSLELAAAARWINWLTSSGVRFSTGVTGGGTLGR